MASNPNPNFDEHRWVIHIRETLEDELDSGETEVPVCIFTVPKTLMATYPYAYTPQEVAIGPYHCSRPEVYEMERYKLAAAKRTQKHFQGDRKFQYVIDQLTKLEPRIRACYHKFLSFSNETLAWIMAIDASFLLEFFEINAIKEGKVDASVSSRSMSHLIDYAGIKASHNAILRDMVMLENQIPLFVLRKMLEVQHSSLESADDMLQVMLMEFCEELSPFRTMKDSSNISVSECDHLLDFLYKTIVPKAEQKTEMTEIEDQDGEKLQKESFFADSSNVKQFLTLVWKLLSKLNKGPVRLIKKFLISRPVKVMLKMPWTMLSKIPGFSVLAQPIQYLSIQRFTILAQTIQHLLFSQGGGEQDQENEISSRSNNTTKPPLLEEIAVPSVTDLVNCQVRFVAANGNISSISFDTKTATFQLPTISLDVNTEVVLRNLVAYESSNAYGPLAFTRYTELMNGIIDTEEDVKWLREKGIILNRLKSDAEVANLWNGMNKSIRLTKVPDIDKVIDNVNKYYNSRWKVKFGKFLKLYVFGSWQFLTFLATIMLLVLMALQAACSVYNCRRFNIASTSD